MSSNGDWGTGFLAGCILSTLVLTAFFIHVRNQGRDECDNKLPRTEKCVQVWVPEARSKP
jgi:hypothetical protein